MDMERRLAVGIVGNVADQRRNFDLFADRNFLVLLLLPIEIAQNRVAQRTDSGEGSGVNILALDDRQERTSSPVARTTVNVRCPLAS